jgi:hypothetical protein
MRRPSSLLIGGTLVALAACATQNRDVAAGNPSPISSGCAQDCSKIVAASCFEGSCNELTGECEIVPSADGTACDDGLFCTVGETCSKGVCGNDQPNPCSQSDCIEGVCNEATRQCLLTPRPDKTPCTIHGDACIVGATCQSGECVGAPKDCSFAPGIDECHNATCNAATGACDVAPGNDGAPCHAQMSCVLDQTCWKGACQGGRTATGPYNPSTAPNVCNENICNPIDGTFTNQTVAVGAACNDPLSGSGDECHTGICAQGADGGQCAAVLQLGASCASKVDDCSYGTCDQEGACATSPTNEGAACNPRDLCTVSATCRAGSCQGSRKSGVTIDYWTDFGAGMGGWTPAMSTGSLWVVRPAVANGAHEPEKDHTATMDQQMLACGFGVSGDWIQSPVIDTSGATGSVWLTLWSAIQTQGDLKATVSVFNGTAWVDVWSTIFDEVRDEYTWSAIVVDVTQYKNPMFRVRLGFEDGDPQRLGATDSWFIDDVTVGNQACAVASGTGGAGEGS